MYRHVVVTASIAMGLLSQASIAKPIERLEEKRPVVAAQLKADARQYPKAYQQVREDALNNPGKAHKVVSTARERPVATTHLYKKAKANPGEARAVYRDAKSNRDTAVRAYNRASNNPEKVRQLKKVSDKRQKYKKAKRKTQQ
ncbi:MAG: hypothetical protein ACPH55_05370 [Luminiphilus sp.]